MHVVVIGVTTAHYLSELRCDVTVIDRSSNVADGASYCTVGRRSGDPAWTACA